MKREDIPAVSIGVPVYNGAKTLPSAIASLLGQTFSDFEIIISDNASTDETGNICRRFAADDPRIRYVRQSTNIGATNNFAFVLQEARAPLFMWAAADDRRSPSFLDITLQLIDADNVVSASARSATEAGSLGEWMPLTSEEPAARVDRFLRSAWRSNALFYGVHRTDALRSYPLISESFAAADWAIIVHLASIGKMLMTEQSHIVIGTGGTSNRPDKWAMFRTRNIEYLFPLYRVTKFTLGMTRSAGLVWQCKIGYRLALLNVSAFYNQVVGASYQWYFRHLRRFVRRGQLE